jgi:hypothetical protein
MEGVIIKSRSTQTFTRARHVGIPVFAYTMKHVTFRYCLKHHVISNIPRWQRTSKLFTVLKLVKIFFHSILHLPLRTSHCYLRVFLQAHQVHFQLQLLTTFDMLTDRYERH